jgi:hypothetical protein
MAEIASQFLADYSALQSMSMDLSTATVRFDPPAAGLGVRRDKAVLSSG